MARRKLAVPYTPPTAWDAGATGPANRERQRLEPATDINPETGRETPNPNNVRRYRRDTWVQVYARQGHLDARHEAAAVKLVMAAEGMRERDPLAAIGEVRSIGGDRQASMIDARRYFRALWAAVPQACRPVIERVVINDEPLWRGHGGARREAHFRRLREGLDAVG